MNQWKMMQDLTMANAISGYEKEARNVMKQYIEPFADEVQTDKLGSLIALKRGVPNGPKIMVAGHLDEIGFIVSFITDDGYVKFQTIGGWWNQNMLSQRVTITTRTGQEYVGIIGSKPPHILTVSERAKPVEITDMYIDLGVASKAELLALGVRPGDAITPYFETQKMANEKYLLAKAWDNRVGCVVAIEVLRQLEGVTIPNTVYSVGTVQEEVGLRGAQTSAMMIAPDIALVVDVCVGQSHGLDESKVLATLGGGPALGLFDAGMIGHQALRHFVEAVAEQKEIPVQYDVQPGGATDGGKIHLVNHGVPTINISIPSRYIHSNVSIVHQDDIDHAAKLIAAVIQKMDHAAVTAISTYE